MDQLTQDQRIAAEEMEAVLGFDLDQTGLTDKDHIRDPRTGRIVGGIDGSDSQLNVAFSLESVLDKLETVRARKTGDLAPKYKDIAFITVSAPGQEKDTLIHTPVTDYYQWRFPHEWQAFEKGQEARQSGTPLALWPAMTPSQIKELNYQGIHTVEQVANLSDSVGGLRNFNALKQKAKQFLEGNKDKAAVGVLQAELNERDAQHKAELAAMQQQLSQMAELIKSKKGAKSPE